MERRAQNKKSSYIVLKDSGNCSLDVDSQAKLDFMRSSIEINECYGYQKIDHSPYEIDQAAKPFNTKFEIENGQCIVQLRHNYQHDVPIHSNHLETEQIQQKWDHCYLDTHETLNDEDDCERKSIISNVNSIISRLIQQNNSLKNDCSQWIHRREADFVQELPDTQIEQQLPQPYEPSNSTIQEIDKDCTVSRVATQLDEQLCNSAIENLDDNIEMKEKLQKQILPKPAKESQKKSSKKGAKLRVITECRHVNSKHYAKGMCNYCYHTLGRKKLATKCEHTDKLNYAKGLCHNCYNKQTTTIAKSKRIKKQKTAA